MISQNKSAAQQRKQAAETAELEKELDELHFTLPPANAVKDLVKKKYAVIFDLDGTLVDTSKSYDKTIAALVCKYSGHELSSNELKKLREEGGFNDDWVTTIELLKRRGVNLKLEEITEEAVQLYLSLAAESETLLIDNQLLRRLGAIYPLFIVTGRTRLEYERVWGERLNPYFEKIYCVDDAIGKSPKPSPDYLNLVISENNLSSGVYIGNSVDDMQSAKAAQLDSIGFTFDHSAPVLRKAGAQITVSTLNQLEKIFNL